MLSNPIYVAHRGYSAIYPDNSPIAFERALDFPIRMIETDIRLNGEGEWIIHHDQVIKPHHQLKSKLFSNLSNQECNEMVLLTITELLNALGQSKKPISLYLDIKGHPTTTDLQYLIKILQNHPDWKPEQFWLASFNYHIVRALIDLQNREVFPYQIGYIGGFYPLCYPIISLIDFVSTDQDEVDQAYLDHIHTIRPELKIFVYTINDPTLWKYYHQLKGVYGILTDDLTLIT